MRFGYPAINIELALHQSDPIEFLACVALGEKPPSRILNTVAVGVVCAIPPYPFPGGKTEEVVGVPIWGVTPGIMDNLHFCDIQAGKDAEFESAGAYLLVSTGTGVTVSEARREAERILNRLTIPASPFWRIDIGRRLNAQLPKLQEHGYAMGLSYA
jgi:phosphoribosylamine-glycine ligase